MTQLPYHRYLLWIHLRGWDEEQIRTHLDELSLPAPTSTIYHEYSQMMANTPLSLMAKRRLARGELNAQDCATFSKMGFRELYLTSCTSVPETLWTPHDTETFAVVTKIVDNPVARVAIDCALLSGLKFEELKPLVEYSYSIFLTAEAIEVYQRLYFDTKLQTKVSWREYLKLLVPDPYSYTRYLAALTASRDEVLHLVGLPTKPAFSNFLKKVLSKAEYKFSFYSNQNTEEGDTAARKWAKLGIEAGVKHEVFAKADITDFSAVLQTEFEFVEVEIPGATAEMLSDVRPPSADVGKNPNPAPPANSIDLEP